MNSCRNAQFDNDFALTYWSSNNGGEIQFAKEMVLSWNELNPDNKIFYQPVPEGQSSEEIILASVVGKTTPDIYSNIWQGTVEFYANSGILIALDTIEGFWQFIEERCSPETIDEITSNDGHIYQVPWKINPIMMIYNQKLLESVGLEYPPSTYEEYLSAASYFKKDNDGDGYVDQWFGNTSVKLAWYQRLFNFYPLYLASSGGLPLIEDGKAAFNNQYAVEVFGFLQELYRENYFSKEQQSAGRDMFVGQRFATKFTGPWEIQYLEKFKSDGLEYNFAPMPVPVGHNGPVYTYCDPKSMVVFNTCKNPELAFQFIKSMCDLEGDRIFIETTYQLPRRDGLDTLDRFKDFFANNPKLQIFANQANHVRGVDNCEVLTEVFDIISQEYEACVLYNLKSPELAIADAERAVNILLRVKE